jgi:hypothetical protein
MRCWVAHDTTFTVLRRAPPGAPEELVGLAAEDANVRPVYQGGRVGVEMTA